MHLQCKQSTTDVPAHAILTQIEEKVHSDYQSDYLSDFDKTDDEAPKGNGKEPIRDNEEEILDEIDEGIWNSTV